MKADAKSRLAASSGQKGNAGRAGAGAGAHPLSRPAALTPFGGLSYPNHDDLGRPLPLRDQSQGACPDGLTVGEDLWRRAARGIQSQGCVDDPALTRLRVETAEEGRRRLEEKFGEYAYRDVWEGLTGGERKPKRHSAPPAVSEGDLFSFYGPGRAGCLGLEDEEKTGKDGARIPVNKRGSTGSRDFKPTRPATFGARGGV